MSVNGKQIAPAKPKPLRSGDTILIGQTTLTVGLSRSSNEGTIVLPTRPTTNIFRWFLLGCSGFAILVGLGLVVVAVGGYLLNWQLPAGLPIALGASPSYTPPQPPTLTPAPSLTPRPTVVNANVTVLAVSTPPALLPPQQFADRSAELGAAIATLNISELDVLQHINANPSGGGLFLRIFSSPLSDELDDKLLKAAADALHVAALADDLSRTAVAQEGGSPNADQLASQYQSIAQLTAALVIDVQNWRAGLAAGQITTQEVAAAITEYGARLWNTEVTDPTGNARPFSTTAPAGIPAPTTINAGEVNSLLNAGAGLPPFWMAFTSETETKKLFIPPAKAPPMDLNDPATVALLTTVEGQQTAPDAARQLAASIINAGEGVNNPAGGEVVAAYASAMAVSAPAPNSTNPPAPTLPTFPKGSAATIIKPESEGNIVTTLFGVDQNNIPTVTGQVPLTEPQPLVTLTISKLVVNEVITRPKDSSTTFEANIVYEFDVQWSSNLSAPQFELDCAGGNHFEITSASGTQHIKAKGNLILYPGAADAYRYASRNGNTWGSSSVRFLVGDAAEATQRANPVETDSVSLNLTLTADALGTQSIQQTGTAQAQAALQTENALSTEVSGTSAAEAPATGTAFALTQQIAAPLTATAAAAQFLSEGTATRQAVLTQQAANVPAAFTTKGSHTLRQSDGGGCNFSRSPLTTGSLEITVDFAKGTASGSFSGGGSGVRAGLVCGTDKGDLHWSQSYTGTLSGTLDPNSGAVILTGTIGGTDSSFWSDCYDGDQPMSCPSTGGGYAFPIKFAGTIDKITGAGQGTFVVSDIAFATSGDWTVSK